MERVENKAAMFAAEAVDRLYEWLGKAIGSGGATARGRAGPPLRRTLIFSTQLPTVGDKPAMQAAPARSRGRRSVDPPGGAGALGDRRHGGCVESLDAVVRMPLADNRP